MIELNNEIFFFFYNLAHQNIYLDYLIIYFSVFLPYLVVFFAILFLIFHKDGNNFFSIKDFILRFKKRWEEIRLIFFSSILAWLVATFLKFLFSTDRPFIVFSNVIPFFNKTDHSFPSGHATFFMALAVAIYLYHKRASYVFIFFALIIGLARIAVGVHFPVDIVAGFALGIIVPICIKYFFYKKKFI